MSLGDLIRRRLPEIAFAALFGAGLVLGGNAALAGLPDFVDAALPGMAAQADVGDGLANGVARLTVPQGFTDSYFAPQVLYPVPQNSMPGWLVEAIREASLSAPPPLRGVPSNTSAAKHPVIAICIDDLGEDLAGTDKAMALPREVALSFLPYADTTPFLAEAAARRGHLVLAHVPMQALGGEDPGPMALKSGMAADEIARRLGWNLSRVPGLVGINNHEGSRFTADGAGLVPVMATLKARHLFFFDSRTGPDSLAEAAAHAAGVTTAGRDIFLDDDQSAVAVSAELEMLAREAKRTGVAIAIGHPHDVTLKLLAAWLAKDHGVTLVPLDEAIRLKNQHPMAIAAR
ncbi:MAG TPA: divergent polysaccharide deacetylase family protein [Rhizomicrobium sp.]|nr:divergent polysaccharide deacetylase family protein [Rhizomicrobium sp.]